MRERSLVHLLDLVILIVYLGGVVLFGAWFSRAQRNVRDYFVSGRRMPWWAVMASIVATETSTVTFISVPGFAFGADFTFLQLVFGYLIGRLAITFLFVPAYFRGDLLTVYQLLGSRFGGAVRRLIASIFLVTRSLADGFRLFATGLMLSAAMATLPALGNDAARVPGGTDERLFILIVAVVVIGIATVAYTYLGGMTAVIWTDLIQLGVYVVGAIVAAVILLAQIPGGWSEVVSVGAEAGKFRLFDPAWDITRSYTLWSGIIGGAFLTTATHGTDQLLVQRYLCTRSPGDARKALLASGVAVLVQFALFLLIGVMLYVYYVHHAPGELAAITLDGRVQSDRVFPHFIVTHLPVGLAGLVTAAVFAAAMSTLSSSLNSSSAAAVADFYVPLVPHRSDAHYLRVSRYFTAFWGVIQVAVALVAIQVSRRVVDEVLGIAAFTNGLILGIFLLGTLTRHVEQRAALIGLASGAAVMLSVRLFTPVSWQWYVLIGSAATFLVGCAAQDAGIGGRGTSRRPVEESGRPRSFETT